MGAYVPEVSTYLVLKYFKAHGGGQAFQVQFKLKSTIFCVKIASIELTKMEKWTGANVINKI